MAGVKGSQPGNLASPVPGAEVLPPVVPKAVPMPAGTPAPNEPMPQGTPPPPEQAMQQPAEQPDPLAALAQEHAAPAETDPLTALAQEHGGELGVVDSVKQYGSDLVTRFKASFGTEDQKHQLLEQTFGKENVRNEKGDFFVKRNGKEEKFSRGMLDMANEMAQVMVPAYGAYKFLSEGKIPGSQLPQDVADLAKPIVAEAVALPLELAATPAAPATGGASLALARLAGGAAGEVVTRGIGVGLGLPADRNQKPEDLLTHAAVAGSLRAVLGLGADKVGGWIASKSAARAATAAEKAAALDALPEQSVANMTKDIKETEAVLEHMKSEGIINGEFRLRPDQMTQEPNLQAAAKQASKSSIFRDMAERQGQMLLGAWDKLTGAAARMTGKAAELGNRTIEHLTSSDKAYGALIGDMRDRLLQKAPNSQIEALETRGMVDNLLGELGFIRRKDIAGKTEYVVRPELAAANNNAGRVAEAHTFTDIAGNRVGNQASYIDAGGNVAFRGASGAGDAGIRTIGKNAHEEFVAGKLDISTNDRLEVARKLISWTNKLNDSMANNGGQLSVKEMHGLYRELVGTINNRIGGTQDRAAIKLMINLKDALRDDMAMGITKTLGAMEGIEYGGAMGRYKMFREAEKSLGGLLERQGMTTEAFVDHVFSKGPNGYERLTTMKKVLDATDPTAFDELKGAFMKRLMDKNPLTEAKSDRLGSYNWKGIRKGFESLGDDTLKQIYSAKELEGMKSFFTIAEKMQRADFAYVANAPPKNMAAKMLNMITSLKTFHRSSPGAISADAVDIASHIAPDELAVKYLTNGGVADIMKLVPTARKREVRSFLDKMIDTSLKAGQVATAKGPLKTAPVVGEVSRQIGESYSPFSDKQ